MPSGLRQKVEEWAGYPLPDHQDEETCSAWADTKYEEVVRSLREATRDTSRFPLVFAENVNYGYRRNLWGLRPFGTPIAVILTLCSWTLLALTIWGRPWPEPWWDIFPNPGQRRGHPACGRSCEHEYRRLLAVLGKAIMGQGHG